MPRGRGLAEVYRLPDRPLLLAGCSAVAAGDLLGLRPVWPRGRDEQGLAVVLQLLDAVEDVSQRAVAAVLLRRVVVGPRVPPTSQLLQRRDVDQPVVQVGVELGHVPAEEATVGVDRAAGER